MPVQVKSLCSRRKPFQKEWMAAPKLPLPQKKSLPAATMRLKMKDLEPHLKPKDRGIFVAIRMLSLAVMRLHMPECSFAKVRDLIVS